MSSTKVPPISWNVPVSAALSVRLRSQPWTQRRYSSSFLSSSCYLVAAGTSADVGIKRRQHLQLRLRNCGAFFDVQLSAAWRGGKKRGGSTVSSLIRGEV